MELRYKEDRRSLFFVMLYFITATLSYIYFPEEWYLIIPIVVVNCLLSFACAIIIHNTVHAPIFKKRIWNKVFQVVLSFTYGHSVSAYVSGHNFSHHKYTQTLKDRIRTDKMRFKINFFNQLFFFFKVAPGIVQDENNFAKLMYKEKPKWFWQYVFELVLVVGTKITLVVLNPFVGIMVLVIPHFYAVWGVLGTNYWQHDGCDQSHPYNHTRNFTNKVLNYFFFNNGYHSAHHDKANLHWSLLPEYHAKHIAPNIHPNLNRDSLFDYLWEAHVYPGKRLDYLGKSVVLRSKKDDVDWIADVELNAGKYDLGVEQ